MEKWGKDKIKVEIHIAKYYKSSKFAKIMKALSNSLIKDGLLSLLDITSFLIIEKLPKCISIRKKRIYVYYGKNYFYIYPKSVHICKRSEGMIIKMEINELKLDEVVNYLADQKLSNNQMVYELVKGINSAANEKEKLELIQFLLNWANRNNVYNIVVTSLLKSENTFAEMIKNFGIDIKSVEIE